MSDNPTPNEGEVPYGAVLAELRGLRTIVDTRFDAVEREQDQTREWVGRCSTAIDRMSETLTRTVAIETRLAATEGDVSDMKLDVAGVQAEIVALKEERSKNRFIREGLIGFVGAALTAIGMKVLGLEGHK